VDHGLRRGRLAERLGELGVESLLVTELPNVRYLSGFTGSNGALLVAPTASVFFTDGRYAEQARREVPDVRGKASGNGHPVGAGSSGSARKAAGGAPEGTPSPARAVGAAIRAASIVSVRTRSMHPRTSLFPITCPFRA